METRTANKSRYRLELYKPQDSRCKFKLFSAFRADSVPTLF